MKIIGKVAFILFFSLSPAFAVSEGNINYWGYTLKAFGSLILVVGVIIIFFFALRKIGSFARKSNSRIKMKSRLFLDNKHYLSIVEIDEKEYLIGVGDNVNLLKEFSGKNEKN